MKARPSTLRRAITSSRPRPTSLSQPTSQSLPTSRSRLTSPSRPTDPNPRTGLSRLTDLGRGTRTKFSPLLLTRPRPRRPRRRQRPPRRRRLLRLRLSLRLRSPRLRRQRLRRLRLRRRGTRGLHRARTTTSRTGVESEVSLGVNSNERLFNRHIKLSTKTSFENSVEKSVEIELKNLFEPHPGTLAIHSLLHIYDLQYLSMSSHNLQGSRLHVEFKPQENKSHPKHRESSRRSLNIRGVHWSPCFRVARCRCITKVKKRRK